MVLKSKAALKSHSTSKSHEKVEAEASVSAKKAGTKSPTRPKSPGRPRSPGRPKSPVRTRSPARTKSPSRRSPARSKKEASPPLQSSTPKIPSPKARSPIRRSPARKSPTRGVKATSKSVETVVSDKPRRPRKNLEMDTDSDNPDFEFEHVSGKPQAAVRGRARRLEVQVEKIDVKNTELGSHLNVIKRITRNSQNREVERIVHLKHFDTVTNKLGEFSDEDEVTQFRKSHSVERGHDFEQINEFGGWFGALFLTLLFPLTVAGLFITCNDYQCSFVKLPAFGKYRLLSTYFDLTTALAFIGYATVLAILSVIPFGGRKVAGLPTKQGKFTYVMNGLFSFVILTTIIIGLELRHIHVLDFIVDHAFHLFITSYIFGLSLAIYAYIRSFYVPFSSLNAHVVGKNPIYAFFMGRELSPRVFGLLDLKIYVLRLAVIGLIIMDAAYLYKNLNWRVLTDGDIDWKSFSVNPTLVALLLLHSIYYFGSLANESAVVTTFEVQYEGFGYMSAVGILLFPFLLASVTKYVAVYNVQFPVWKLILINLVFLFGFLLYKGSNNQKDAFRKNPYDPALSHLETIPTTKGKKLICSGFWGVVRHPNYLGDIFINLAFGAFAYNVPPVVTCISTVLLLIYRAKRDNARCKQKYGAAWDRYCSRVKYVLIPKVY